MSRQAILVLAVLGGAVALAALMIFLRPEAEEQERIEQAPLVQTAPFESATGELEVRGSGTVQPRESVTVGAEVAGRLVYVNPDFREGRMVARGATLFRIDPVDFQNQVRSARADVAAQDVAVLQAREEVEIARDELERFSQRQATRDVLQAGIDPDDYAARILPPTVLARQAFSGSRDGAASSAPAPSRLATREPQLRSAQAARERAAANLEAAQLSLSRTRISAPFGSLVREESAAVGTLVQPGQALGTLVATDAFEVRVALTENEAALIPSLLRPGGGRIPASVFFDYGGITYRWEAFVDRADPILDPETRTIDVFLRVPAPLQGGQPVTEDAPPGPPLLLGSFVDARITGEASVPFARIPVTALRPGNEVWVVRDGRLRILPVRVIQRTDEIAYVTTPSLAAGGRIVTSNLRAPTDGMRVRTQAPQGRRQEQRQSASNEQPTGE
ncbi:efflux RND transporter periplasmic adaptor subunit [Alteriqipengyuania lutimaris]|uniref:HlyD family efflux transporter periplasmic adaptor subunit n=1 Tax=Alteriqipengyuania lutimaris TaxID=1538146 RepID=A0A395LJU5_9SPHN|nr:HlyD family efflux transporter periplasmic adaptor subunit [Alteriqipengyuania lutimaris]MBB3033741.1 RND family efflux transporter MFP subunit [Alteriqipengyuania lutimaris]RDS77276.1 HlyD family efflux transporter periplasmic adaptor subunit [Alteriqipengyuania lutimaris]